MKRRQPERSEWRGEGVRVEQVVAELGRLHRAHQREGRGHGLTRTLNLIVAPAGADGAVDAALAGLGAHSPSRTLILRRGDDDRLDAEAALECELHAAAGRVGVCHDQVELTAGASRLEHAASLVAPLLLSDLPTVLWLPDPGVAIPDPRLLERSQQVLVDSTSEAPLGRLAELGRQARVHDLAWGRLEFWRAATAAAFEPPERRSLIPRITALEVWYGGDSLSPALLLAGWISARADWRVEMLERDGGHARVTATRPDGGTVSLSLNSDPSAHGCGGIESLEFRADTSEIRLARGAATSRLRDLFAEALQPVGSFARGYAAAVGVAAEMLGGAGAEAAG